MHRPVIGTARRLTTSLAVVSIAAGLTACGSVGILRGDPTLAKAYVDPAAPAITPAELTGEGGGSYFTAHIPGTITTVADLPAAVPSASPALSVEDAAALVADAGLSLFDIAQSGAPAPSAQAKDADVAEQEEEYDPWEPFNEKMFAFNRKLDRYVLKPVAKVYNVLMPEPFQQMIANGFDNIRWVPRFINSILQGKWGGAGREFARFLINSTAGIGGLFDPAKNYWGIEKSREDFGQTLGVWGSGPGPYLILPFLPPLTVRDGIGYGVDTLLDPLSYVLPFFWDRLGMKLGDTINDRSLNLDLYEGFEESVIDMYSAVRNGYLRRREQLIRE